MSTITRTIHVAHNNGQLLGGLLHYILAASNGTAKALRRGVRGKELRRRAVHHTRVYQTRFADYIVLDVFGSHKAWRTKQLTDKHARAPHFRNPVAQTDIFELVFNDTSKRWNGTPSIHVAVYGMGRQNRSWMAFPVPPYVVNELGRPNRTPKTVSINRDEIFITYQENVQDSKAVMWAGVDMNAKNNAYSFTDGTVTIVGNRNGSEYNRACSRILKVRRRNDDRVMTKYTGKAWKTYGDRIRNDVHVEAKRLANARCVVGFETLNIHNLYNKNGKMSPYVRGKTKATLNTGQRQAALKNAAESAGLPSVGVEPRNTSAKCHKCGGRLAFHSKRSGEVPLRNMRCGGVCRAMRERDANASTNILLLTIRELMGDSVVSTGTITTSELLQLLKVVVANRTVPHRKKLIDIMRLLEGRSANTLWCLSGAHKPKHRNYVDGDSMGVFGAGDAGRNGPGPPNAAKL